MASKRQHQKQFALCSSCCVLDSAQRIQLAYMGHIVLERLMANVLFQDRDRFKGRQIIARELTTENLDIARGKKVVVIGRAKSALDVAGAAGEVAESVKMLSRQVGNFVYM